MRKRKSLLDGGHNGFYHSSGRNGKSHIIGIGRLRDNDFISRIQTGEKSEKHSFAASGGDDDVIRTHFNLILVIIGNEFFPKRAETITRTVLQDLSVNIAQCIKTLLRSLYVWLSYIELVYFDTLAHCLLCKREEFSDW